MLVTDLRPPIISLLRTVSSWRHWTVWDTWSSDMLAFSISSNHVTTFTFEIYSGSRLWLDPKLFSLLPNLKSCHIERNQWEEILEDEWPGNETRAHNDMVLSGLLRKSHPETLTSVPPIWPA